MSNDKERPTNSKNTETDDDQNEVFEGTEIEPQEPQETTQLPAPDYPEQIQQLKLELDEYKDLFLRKAADFENYKKRKQAECSVIARSTEEQLISQLLPVLDDFERLFYNAEEEQYDREAFLRGAKLIYDKLMKMLEARGVKAVESVGQPFDPQLHEAILQQPQSGVEPGTVLQEYERGYRLGDKVVRHAKVVVSS
jgi:molecular chaperone GrpE